MLLIIHFNNCKYLAWVYIKLNTCPHYAKHPFHSSIVIETTKLQLHILSHKLYRNPSLGLATKTRACKGADQQWSPRVTFHAIESWQCKRVWENEHSHSQMNSHFESWTPDGLSMDFRIFKERLQGSKPIRKFLEHRCLKWVRMTHLDIWNTSYSEKKGRKSNC